MKEDFKAKIITLPKAYEMAHKVSRQITNSSDNFDIVVGISRGGLPPARMICDFLNINTLTSLQISHYTGGGEEKDKVELTDPINIDLKGTNVLIVDDVNDSGKTLKAAYEYIESLDPDLVKIAVLHEKENTVFNAHYTGPQLSEWRWLIYQWAVTEDLLEFLEKDRMLQATDEEAIGHLKEKYDLEIDNDLFKKVISMRKNYIAE